MTTQEVKQLIIEAHLSGSIAFKNGKPCVPSLDREFNKKTFGLPHNVTMRVLKEWIHGYTVAMTTPVNI
jgi:hypothetical protein